MKKHKRKELGLVPLTLLGTAFAILVIVSVTFAMSLISSFTKDPSSLTGAFSLITLLLAGGISGFVTSRANGDGGSLISIISALISAFLIIIIGLIWGKGMMNVGVFINTLAFVGVSILFAVLGKKRVKRGRRRYM